MWKSLITKNLPFLAKSRTAEGLNREPIMSEKKEAEAIRVKTPEQLKMSFSYGVTIAEKKGKGKGRFVLAIPNLKKHGIEAWDGE
jgi:hypothetical protein